jgi:hypothetical protein
VPTLTGNWIKRETFGYSLNGKEFSVAQGQSYTAVIDSNNGTTAKILSGVNTSTAMESSGRACTQVVGTGWSPGTTAGITGLASRTFYLWGMANAMGSGQTGTFTLSLSYTPPASSAAIQQGNFGIIARNSNDSWVNAADVNYGGTKTFVLGPWTTGATLGTYGVDTTTQTAWAVINFNGHFAVAPFGQVGVSLPSVKQLFPAGSKVFLKGNKLVLPDRFRGESVAIEVFSLSGRLIAHATAVRDFLDVSNLRKTFQNREIVVKCVSGNDQDIQKIFVY